MRGQGHQCDCPGNGEENQRVQVAVQANGDVSHIACVLHRALCDGSVGVFAGEYLVLPAIRSRAGLGGIRLFLRACGVAVVPMSLSRAPAVLR